MIRSLLLRAGMPLVGVLVALLATAAPAAAHGADAPNGSDYRVGVSGLAPARDGVDVRTVEAGARLELRNRTDRTITVLGYSGEPYLQVRPDVLEARVPSLLLQPLVENAVRHGIAPLQRGGRVTVSAAREGGRLLLTVEDDGAGALSEGAPREGVGLRNTRARLERLYPQTHDLTIDRPDTGGFRVRVGIPFSTGATSNGSNGGGSRP